jgi:hypothetical protein
MMKMMKMMRYRAIMALLVFLMYSSGFYIPNYKRARHHVLKVADELKVIRRFIYSLSCRSKGLIALFIIFREICEK